LIGNGASFDPNPTDLLLNPKLKYGLTATPAESLYFVSVVE